MFDERPVCVQTKDLELVGIRGRFRLQLIATKRTAMTPPSWGRTPDCCASGTVSYAFLTPFILIIGLIGNSMSLKVFTSRVMRRLSSSTYLMALSVSDMLVLLTYVLLDWLNDGTQVLAWRLQVWYHICFHNSANYGYLHRMNKVRSKTLLRICLATVKGITNVKVKMNFFIPQRISFSFFALFA